MQPIPIIEFDEGQTIDLSRRVPLKELLAEHRKRWRVETKLGVLVLKRISQVELEEIAVRMARNHPNYALMQEEAQTLWMRHSLGESLTPEEQSRMNAIAIEMMPFMKEFALAIFVEPKMRDIEELDVLLGALPPEERAQVYKLVTDLCDPSLDGKVSVGTLEIAKDFNIKISDDLNMTNMTARQHTALRQVQEEQARQVERAIEGR